VAFSRGVPVLHKKWYDTVAGLEMKRMGYLSRVQVTCGVASTASRWYFLSRVWNRSDEGVGVREYVAAFGWYLKQTTHSINCGKGWWFGYLSRLPCEYISVPPLPVVVYLIVLPIGTVVEVGARSL